MNMEGENSETEIEEPPLRLQLFLAAGIGIIIIVGMSLTILIADFLGLRLGAISLIGGFRMLMGLIYFAMGLPFCVFSEFWYSRWKKRTFRLRNIAMLSVSIGGGILLIVAISSFFEMIFPSLEPVDQAPILGISVGIALLALAATSRVHRVRSFLKKAFG